MKSKALPTARNAFPKANAVLLALAWLAAWAVYSPVIGAGWFYDDADYVLADPRLNHLELFLPGHWSSPPPEIEGVKEGTFFLPGYDKPVIADRYLWRLSLALERRIWGAADTPAVAHTINLFIHLACVTALFFALRRLVRLYAPAPDLRKTRWDLLPGFAALIFAVHPWAAEPVCYVSARNGSLGAFFALVGTGWWIGIFQSASWAKCLLSLAGALLCALAAVGSKENFITVPAGYVLVTAPYLWGRTRAWPRGALVGIGVGAAALLATVAWLGIRSSDRAAGLWAQSGDGRGWLYFFNVQNPLVLMTLGDQLPVRRLSLESNHPGWPDWACGMALAANAVLFLLGTLGGMWRPLLLALGWFFLHLLPTNSFLPRPDFLGARNVYLPVAGVATLFAGALLWAWAACQARSASSVRRARTILGAASLALWIYWLAAAGTWARCFLEPERVWSRSAAIAPDHAAVRLNLAGCVFRRFEDKRAGQAETEREFHAALAAEDSPTMQYQPPRHRMMRSAMALRSLGIIQTRVPDMPKAEEFFRRSWTVMPSAQAWVGWAYACLSSNLAPQLEDALAEGLRHWPQAWWPPAVRGLHRAGPSARLSADVCADLERAERAPDETMVELRSLQSLAIYRLTQSASTPANLGARLERLRRLGIPAQDVEHLQRFVEANLNTAQGR